MSDSLNTGVYMSALYCGGVYTYALYYGGVSTYALYYELWRGLHLFPVLWTVEGSTLMPCTVEESTLMPCTMEGSSLTWSWTCTLCHWSLSGVWTWALLYSTQLGPVLVGIFLFVLNGSSFGDNISYAKYERISGNYHLAIFLRNLS